MIYKTNEKEPPFFHVFLAKKGINGEWEEVKREWSGDFEPEYSFTDSFGEYTHWKEISIAERLLIDLNKGKKVSRHQIFRNTSAIKIYLEEEKYKHLHEKIHDLITSAQESY